MSLTQRIMFGIVFPLMFCSIGGFFARQGYLYFKTKKAENASYPRWYAPFSAFTLLIVEHFIPFFSTSVRFQFNYFPSYNSNLYF